MKLSEILEETLSLKKEDQKDRVKFHDLDEWDSMAFMFLITKIEEIYNIELDNDKLAEMKTVGDLKQILESYGLDTNGV